VIGAFIGSRLVGACVGFFGASGPSTLHSHLAAVEPSLRTRGIGFALKVHQRAWSLSVGVQRISWTYDPLISRNAYLNITKLRADPQEYLENFYGQRDYGITAQLPTDRVLVTWQLGSGSVHEACSDIRSPAPDVRALRLEGAAVLLAPDREGGPVTSADNRHRLAPIGIPRDIAILREARRDLAEEWVRAVRRHLGDGMKAGPRPVGYARDGYYVVDRAPAARLHPEGVS